MNYNTEKGYKINNTEGDIVANVQDGQIDDYSTDITLIGKNYSGYGEAINENFIKILENFSSTKSPTNPLRGQLWFDTTETTLKIYNGTEFIPVSSTTISDRQPASLRVGDLWFDNTNKQLNFYNGSGLTLINPIYTQSQGKCGFVVESILDTLSQTRVITSLYNGGALLGIFSKDSFTPKIPITGFDGTIKPGFNASTLAGLTFNVTCTNAEKLGGISAADFLRTDVSNVIKGQLHIASDLGLIIGDQGTATLLIDENNLVLSNHETGGAMRLSVRRGAIQEPAINIYANDRKVGLYEGYLTSEVEIGGNLKVGGSITVAGDVTTISSSELVVTDKNVVIGQLTDEEGTALPTSDITAEGGGITLKGTTDKSFLWSADPTPSWTTSENFNLVYGKYYAINNYPLIQEIDPADPSQGFKLTDHIKQIDGISIFGKREQLIVGPYPVEDPAWLMIENSTITTYDNHDLELSPDGNIVLTTSPMIKGLADPVDDQDASTKKYVDTQNKLQTIFLSTTLSSVSELIEADYYNLLNTMIPTGSVTVGTLVKLLCTIVQNTGTVVSANTNISTEKFCVSDGFGQPSGSDANAVTSVGVEDITVPAQAVSVSRIIKTFRYEGTGWNHLSDVAWSPS